MADNVAITAGAGTTIAADEVSDGTLGTVKVQYVKIMDGTLDSTTKISPATSGNQATQIASLSSIDGKITACNTGAVVVSSGAITATLANSAKVDCNSSVVTLANSAKVDCNGSNVAVTSAPVTHVIIDSGNPTTITATQGTGTNLHTVVDSGAVTATLANSAKVDCNSSVVTLANSAKVDCNSSNVTIAGGSIANTTFAATQGTATNLKAQAEAYQGGTAVGTGNPLQVSLANTGANSSKLLVTADAITGTVTNTEALLTVAAKTIKVALTASQTGATVVTPTNGKTAYITDIVISATGAGTVYLYDTTDDSTHGVGPILSMSINGGWSSNFRKPYVCQSTSAVLKYTSGSGFAGSLWANYYEV